MTINRNSATWESIIVTPSDPSGGGLAVGDVIDFAQRLVASDVPRDAILHTNDFMRPMPIYGMQFVWNPESKTQADAPTRTETGGCSCGYRAGSRPTQIGCGNSQCPFREMENR